MKTLLLWCPSAALDFFSRAGGSGAKEGDPMATWTSRLANFYMADRNLDSGLMAQGTARVMVPKKESKNIICSATVLDAANMPPIFVHSVQGFRTGK